MRNDELILADCSKPGEVTSLFTWNEGPAHYGNPAPDFVGEWVYITNPYAEGTGSLAAERLNL